MKRGVLVPHLDVAHEQGRDMVWCAALDLAWLALVDLLGGPITLAPTGGGVDPAHDRALSVVRALNATPVTAEVAAAEDAIALAGEDDAELVARAKKVFGDRYPLVGTDETSPSNRGKTLTALAAARVEVPFAVPFEHRSGGWTFDRARVDAFGVWEQEPGTDQDSYEQRVSQVVIHHHRFAFEYDPDGRDEAHGPTEEFVVELLASGSYRVVVACCSPERTFAGTVALTLDRLRESPADARLKPREKLVIPAVDIDVEELVPDLAGFAVANPGFEGHHFGRIAQRVVFELNEGGARASASAVFGGLSLPPRTLVCDAPFLVLVIRKGQRRPFLAGWIETASLLRRDR